MVIKQCRAKGAISSCSEKKDESDAIDNMDLDQTNDEYLLPLQI